MNASNALSVPQRKDSDASAALARALDQFEAKVVQFMSPEALAQVQGLLGHGFEYGIWSTPRELVPQRIQNSLRRVDLRKVVERHVKTLAPRRSIDDRLIEEGVLHLSRYACIVRMAPTGAILVKRNPLDPSSIALKLDQPVGRIVAQAVIRKADANRAQGSPDLLSYLTAEDRSAFEKTSQTSVELNRLTLMSAKGLWPIAPHISEPKRTTTSPKKAASERSTQGKTSPFLPLPDEYLEKMGPKVLWLVQEFGPNFISLLEDLPALFSDIRFTASVKWIVDRRKERLQTYLSKFVWRGRDGRDLLPLPFDLKVNHGATSANAHPRQDWLPTTWSGIKHLTSLLQTAHLWIALLATAGRISEVSALQKDCVQVGRDGKTYANGPTYKLTRSLFGEERQWPAPDILVHALGQQARLITARQKLDALMDGNSGPSLPNGGNLWGGLSDPQGELVAEEEHLKSMATALGLSRKPGGRNLHPHRFRKTIARLAAIAIVGSPKVLQRLFGHRDMAMTLYYILTDKALSAEIEKVARELRVVRSRDLIKDMHEANAVTGAEAYGGHGGVGAVALAQSVRAYEADLNCQGIAWSDSSAHDLAVMLTTNGTAFRLVSEHVICTKGPGDVGLCSKNRGEPNTASCQQGCVSRIEEKTARRDVRELIEALVRNSHRALEQSELLVFESYFNQLRTELARFADIEAEWMAMKTVQSLFTKHEELMQ